jgi:hypothetical protein
MTSPTKTMTGADLKVALGGLGIPPSWFAAKMNVTMRTVVRWFDGGQVSPDVVRQVDFLCDRTEKEMRKLLSGARESARGAVILQTYRTDEEFESQIGWPASWHRMLTFRVKEHLEAQGNTVVVKYR